MKDKIIAKLRDPMTASILAILAIAITIIIFVFQTNTKSLSYEIISNTQIVSVNEESKDKIQITFEGKLVEDVNLIVVEIANDGDIPITKADYESPIIIRPRDQGQILSAEIIEVSPSNLTIPISVSQSAITFKEVLLNSEDKIRLKLLVSNSNLNPEVITRINGINKPRELTKEDLPLIEIPVLMLLIILSMMAWFMALLIILIRKTSVRN